MNTPDLAKILPATPEEGLIPRDSAPNSTVSLADAALTESEIQRLKALVAKATATSTKQAYQSDWERWTRWCEGRCQALPAKPEFVALFVEEHAAAIKPDKTFAFAPTTLKRWVSSINQHHRAAGRLAPGESKIVRDALIGVRRDGDRKYEPKKRAPLLLDDLRQVNESILAEALTRPQRIAARRDIAVLAVGFYGAFRRSELSGLMLSDALAHPEDGLHMRLRRSKTDQEGKGLTKPLPFEEDPLVCPVCAVLRWVQVVSAWDTKGRPGVMRLMLRAEKPGHVCGPGRPTIPATEEPLFRAMHRSGLLRGQMSGHAINEMVMRRAQQAGIDPDRLKDMGGHSMRAGFVTEAYRAGATAEEIARQTDHKSLTVLAGYQREHAPLIGNAVTKIGRKKPQDGSDG